MAFELASRELGRNTPPRRPNKRGSGGPHGVSHSSPQKGFIGPGPATARRDPDRPVMRPRGQDPRARCQHTHVHQTEDGLRNPHSVTRISAPQILTLARKPPTPEAAKPPRTHGIRDRTSGRYLRREETPDWAPTTTTTRFQSATTARGPMGNRRAI